MFAETELFYPYMQNFSQDFQHFEDFCKTQKPNASTNNTVQISTLFDYELEGECDLFKAPDPIVEEPSAGLECDLFKAPDPIVEEPSAGLECDLFKAPDPIVEEPSAGLDPMTAAISFSCSGDVITSQALNASDVESMQNEQFLDVLYECEKDPMVREALETPLADVLDIKIPAVKTDENDMFRDIPFHKSVSSSCLSSMEWMQGAVVEPSFLDLPGMDFGSVYGMRRAFSEGDIQTLGDGNVSVVRSTPEQSITISSCCSIEDRKEKLSRYRNKKTKRNFGRKIKYACRKALADSQPRIRGRFAKTEESDSSKRQYFV